MKKINDFPEHSEEFTEALLRFSHEIRNPLCLLDSELHDLFSSYPELAKLPQWDTITENLAYIHDLLNEFSQYSNARRLTLTTTDLSPYLSTVTNTYKTILDYLGIAFKVHFPDSLPALPIDRLKVRQALLNLIRNSHEAITHSHGEISVCGTLQENGQVCISVSDNGCGIDPSLIPELCTPFVSHKANGSGMGLAIARQIAEAHGGHVEITSTPGVGTCVRLFLSDTK